MKYKLINLKTKEEHLCDKVTIDGFDYYVSDEKINSSNYEDFNFWFYNPYIKELQISCNPNSCHKVIATNNPNIDIPRVVNEIEFLANLEETKEYSDTDPFDPCGYSGTDFNLGFQRGYNKSQETYPFNEDDMIEFETFCNKYDYENGFGKTDRKELLQLWKEQRPKIVYYEN